MTDLSFYLNGKRYAYSGDEGQRVADLCEFIIERKLFSLSSNDSSAAIQCFRENVDKDAVKSIDVHHNGNDFWSRPLHALKYLSDDEITQLIITKKEHIDERKRRRKMEKELKKHQDPKSIEVSPGSRNAYGSGPSSGSPGKNGNGASSGPSQQLTNEHPIAVNYNKSQQLNGGHYTYGDRKNDDAAVSGRYQTPPRQATPRGISSSSGVSAFRSAGRQDTASRIFERSGSRQRTGSLMAISSPQQRTTTPMTQHVSGSQRNVFSDESKNLYNPVLQQSKVTATKQIALTPSSLNSMVSPTTKAPVSDETNQPGTRISTPRNDGSHRENQPYNYQPKQRHYDSYLSGDAHSADERRELDAFITSVLNNKDNLSTLQYVGDIGRGTNSVRAVAGGEAQSNAVEIRLVINNRSQHSRSSSHGQENVTKQIEVPVPSTANDSYIRFEHFYQQHFMSALTQIEHENTSAKPTNLSSNQQWRLMFLDEQEQCIICDSDITLRIFLEQVVEQKKKRTSNSSEKQSILFCSPMASVGQLLKTVTTEPVTYSWVEDEDHMRDEDKALWANLGANISCRKPTPNISSLAHGHDKKPCWKASTMNLITMPISARKAVFAVSTCKISRDCTSTNGRGAIFQFVTASNDKTIRIWEIREEAQQQEDILSGRKPIKMRNVICEMQPSDHSDQIGMTNAKRSKVFSQGIALGCHFNPSGRQVVGSFDDGSVRLWNSSGAFDEYFAMVRSHWLQDRGNAGSSLADRSPSGCSDGGTTANTKSQYFHYYKDKLYYYDYHYWCPKFRGVGTEQFSSVPLSCKVYATKFNNTGAYLVTGAVDQKLRLYNTDIGTLQQVLKGHEAAIYTVDFSPRDNGKLIASGSDDRSIRIWDWRNCPEKYVMNIGSNKVPYEHIGHKGTIWSVKWAHEPLLTGSSGTRPTMSTEYMLCSSSVLSEMKVWDIRRIGDDARALFNLKGQHSAIHSCMFSPTNRFVYGAGQDQNIMCWSLADGGNIVSCHDDYHDFVGDATQKDALCGHTGSVYDIDYVQSGDGSYRLLSASADGSVKIWSMKNV